MAISFDAASSSRYDDVSLTFSHTVGAAGSNRILIVGVGIAANLNVSGITYAGQALTKIRHDINAGAHRNELWYRAVPATGANDIIVSVSGTGDIVAGAMSFTGVAQTSPIEANNGSNADNA